MSPSRPRWPSRWGMCLPPANSMTRHREQVEPGIHVIELFAVTAPFCLHSAGGGNLPFAWPVETGHIDFGGAGFTGRVREPMSVGGNVTKRGERIGGVGYQQRRFALSFQRQGPDLRASHRTTVTNQVLAVARPVGRNNDLFIAEQKLLRPATVGELAVKVGPTVAIGCVGDPL